MNPIDFAQKSPAQLTYLEANYVVEVPGSYVICAISEVKIPLDHLKYWSVDRQEAYKDAATSLIAHKAAIQAM